MIKRSLVETIASLKPGDQFIIHPGEGQPAVDRDKLVTVWMNIESKKIITIDGIVVSPEYNSEIIPTGTRLLELPSLKARSVWQQIQATMTAPNFNGRFENFDSEPE